MAAVTVLQSPHAPLTMSSRRVPLANNTNAVNSPFRSVAAVSGKRTRTQTTDPREMVSGQPPSKKQAIDAELDENLAPRTLTRQSLSQQEAEAKVFTRRSTNAAPTAFEKKLAAVRDKKPQSQKIESQPLKNEAHAQKIDPRAQRQGASLETIRQWRRHYRNAFPQYVFYFESVPEDVRSRVSRQIQYLGAVRDSSSDIQPLLALLLYSLSLFPSCRSTIPAPPPFLSLYPLYHLSFPDPPFLVLAPFHSPSLFPSRFIVSPFLYVTLSSFSLLSILTLT